MTGFGDAELETDVGLLRVEIKTVNHRYFSPSIRLPAACESYEPKVKDWLRERLDRGRVNYALRLDASEEGEPDVELRLNEPRARQYVRVLRELKQAFDLDGRVDISLVSRFDVIERAETETIDVPADALRRVTDAAIDGVVAMREEEGARLHDDLEERLQALDSGIASVRERAPERLTKERDRLRGAVRELAGDVEVDEDRLAREIAFLADRWDISEELVRLESHVAKFRELLDADSDEPVGKRMKFLNQELLRETNTIGSKANDAEIEHRVVGMKNEIERLREQVDNVE